jgi:hypothetical protein
MSRQCIGLKIPQTTVYVAAQHLSISTLRTASNTPAGNHAVGLEMQGERLPFLVPISFCEAIK